MKPQKFITLWVLSYKFSPSRNRLLPQPAHCLHQSGSATSSSMTLVALVMLCKSFLEKNHPTSKGFVSLYWERMKEEERCSALTMGVLEELRDLKWRWTTSAKIQWNMFNIRLRILKLQSGMDIGVIFCLTLALVNIRNIVNNVLTLARVTECQAPISPPMLNIELKVN